MYLSLFDRLCLSLSDLQQVRRARPARELTCDDLNRGLSRQEVLLGSLVQKLQRGTGLVRVDSGKLQDVKQKLTATLKDKVRCCAGGPSCALAIADHLYASPALGRLLRGIVRLH